MLLLPPPPPPSEPSESDDADTALLLPPPPPRGAGCRADSSSDDNTRARPRARRRTPWPCARMRHASGFAHVWLHVAQAAHDGAQHGPHVAAELVALRFDTSAKPRRAPSRLCASGADSPRWRSSGTSPGLLTRWRSLADSSPSVWVAIRRWSPRWKTPSWTRSCPSLSGMMRRMARGVFPHDALPHRHGTWPSLADKRTTQRGARSRKHDTDVTRRVLFATRH